MSVAHRRPNAQTPLLDNALKYKFEVRDHDDGFEIEATDRTEFLTYGTVVAQETLTTMGVRQHVETAKEMLNVAVQPDSTETESKVELQLEVGFIERSRTSSGTEGSDPEEYMKHVQGMKPIRRNLSDSLVLKFSFASRFVKETFWYELPVTNHENEVDLLRLQVIFLQDKVESLAGEVESLTDGRTIDGFRGSKLLALKPAFRTWLSQQFTGSELTPIFRGSDFGFTAAAFHSVCDSRGPFVVLVKAEHREQLFGGFSKCSLSSNGRNVKDSSGQSFVFSEDEPANKKYMCNPASDGHLHNHSGYNPWFGNNNEYTFRLSGQKGFCQNNCSAYTVPNGQFLAGQAEFNVVDFEVFTVF